MNISQDEFRFCKVVKVLYSCKDSLHVESVRSWIRKLKFQEELDFKSKLLVMCDEYENELYKFN